MGVISVECNLVAIIKVLNANAYGRATPHPSASCPAEALALTKVPELAHLESSRRQRLRTDR